MFKSLGKAIVGSLIGLGVGIAFSKIPNMPAFPIPNIATSDVLASVVLVVLAYATSGKSFGSVFTVASGVQISATLIKPIALMLGVAP